MAQLGLARSELTIYFSNWSSLYPSCKITKIRGRKRNSHVFLQITSFVLPDCAIFLYLQQKSNLLWGDLQLKENGQNHITWSKVTNCDPSKCSLEKKIKGNMIVKAKLSKASGNVGFSQSTLILTKTTPSWHAYNTF